MYKTFNSFDELEFDKIITIMYDVSSLYTYVEYERDGKLEIALVFPDPDSLERLLKKIGVDAQVEHVFILHSYYEDGKIKYVTISL